VIVRDQGDLPDAERSGFLGWHGGAFVELKSVLGRRRRGAGLTQIVDITFDEQRFALRRDDAGVHQVYIAGVAHAQSGGRGFSITGHHEIMIPLLAAALREGAA